MNILKKFLTPKWQHKSPQIRKQALLELDKENDKTIIETMAKNDDDVEIRQIAIKRVSNIDVLKDIATSEANPDNRELANKLLSQAIAGVNEINIDDQQRMALLLQIDNPRIIETVAREGKNISLRMAALNKLDKPSLFVDLAINDANSQIRSAALQRIEDPKALERVAKQTKNKDKVIYRESKAKLDAIIAAEERPKRIKAEQERIIRSMEELGRRGDWAGDHTRYLRLQEDWAALGDERSPDISARYCKAAEQFDRLYAEYSARNAERIAEERKWDAIKLQKQAVLENIRELSKQVRAHEFADENEVQSFRSSLQQLTAQWEQGETLPSTHRGDIEKQFSSAVVEVTQYLRDIGEHSAVLSHVTSLAQHVSQLASRPVGSIEQKLKEAEKSLTRASKYLHVDKIKQTVSGIEAHISQIKGRISEKKAELSAITERIESSLKQQMELSRQGLLNDALQVVKKIKTDIKHLGEIDSAMAAKWQRRVREATQDTEKLFDWKKWASAPKKEELIQSVERLIGSDGDPHEIAQQIQSARETWKTLGTSESSKELWDRFNDVCNRAYEPCQQYFAKEAEERQRNQQQREAFVVKLETFINTADWNTVNWKKVEHLIQDAHTEWQTFGQTDWKSRQALGERFHAAVENIRARVQAEWAKNLATKQKIVDEATALINNENTQEASLKVRELQKRWTTAGRIAQKDERRLWKDFRAACDAVFQKRTQKRNEAVEKVRESEHRLVDICENLERIAQLPADEFDSAVANVRVLQDEWKNTSATIEKLSAQLEKRFKEALKDIDENKYILKRRKQLAPILALQERSRICAAMQQAVAINDNARKDSLVKEWATLSALTLPLAKRVDERFQLLQSTMDAKATITSLLDLAEQDKKQLVVRYEILAEIDTPPEFTQDRISYQMNRLAADIGKGISIDPWEGFLNLEQEWYAAGACEPTIEAKLENRRERALNAIGRLFPDELANYI